MNFSMIEKMVEKMNLGPYKGALIPLGSGAAFFIIWLIISIGLNQQSRTLKKELKNLKAQAQQIEAIVDKDKTKEEKIKMLQERYKLLENKFPETEKESLGLLSSYAQEFQMEVVSVKSQPKRAFLDKNRKKVEVGGKACQEIPVAVEMKGAYQAVVQYIETLKETLPAYGVVEKIKMRKDPADPSRLIIYLDLILHLMS